MPPGFAEKTFADGSQTLKSAKVFSLESFPLYGARKYHEFVAKYCYKCIARITISKAMNKRCFLGIVFYCGNNDLLYGE